VNVSPAVLNRGYLWKVLALLIACQMIAYIDRVNLSVAAPVLIRAHGYTAQTLGILFSTFNWVFTVAILFAGPFVDRVRARIAYGTGASLWSLGTLLTGVTTAFVPLMLFRALVGIGEGPMIPAGQRVIRDRFPRRSAPVRSARFSRATRSAWRSGSPSRPSSCTGSACRGCFI
jgi:ACS family D-galactonate transporter-like MFS transporter